jgi:hypothetical protein
MGKKTVIKLLFNDVKLLFNDVKQLFSDVFSTKNLTKRKNNPNHS